LFYFKKEKKKFVKKFIFKKSLFKKKVVLGIDDCWNKFREIKKEFVHNYIAYQHFRNNNWVPKVGIKYGVHWSKFFFFFFFFLF